MTFIKSVRIHFRGSGEITPFLFLDGILKCFFVAEDSLVM